VTRSLAVALQALPGVPAGLLAAAAAACAVPHGRRARRRVRGLRPPRGRRRSTGAAGAVPGPVLLDLAAAVLRSGSPPAGAVRLLADALAGHDESTRRLLLDLAARHDAALPGPAPAADSPGWIERLDAALSLARDAGTGAAPLLAAAAEDERREAAARARAAAARLGVRVVLPAGLCLLPAFVLLTVVPLVLGLLS
jgi:tight adherence protein B